MKIEQQVCSLEWAKKLKALGVKQESILYWKDGRLNCCCEKTTHAIENTTSYSAFTVAELGCLLPFRTKAFQTVNDDELLCIKVGEKWRVVYHDEDKRLYGDNGIVADSGFHDTEANARAAMLVYLLENKLITL